MRSLSWRLILRAVTVLSWVLAILWFVAEPGYEPLIAVVAGIGTLLGSFAASDAPITEYRPTPEQRERNRRAMLDLVRSFWVKGVLEQSLHNAAMIELGMEERLDAVEHPWDMALQTDREDRTLPPGTKIIDVFDEMGRGLLILGEPGSGKTTMLLELARDTIARAEQDPTQPIPIVFNLSSWADKQQPIAEWLVEELNTKYNIPKKIARLWVECDELLLLLDGLDEVALKCREDCIRAINEFREEHLVSLVVCSRVADYEALTARLRLQGAVLLQPLTPQQIDEYLGGAGMALSGVRRTLQDDPTLQELAETPLMLSIMTLAYQGVSVENLQALDTVEARRQHLFDTYVQRMFERRRIDQPYPPRQTIRWLAWLAQKMSEHAQSVFLIEGLQPDWLAAPAQRQLRIVTYLGVGLTIGLVGGLVGGLPTALVFGLVVDPRFDSVAWLVYRLLSFLSGALVVGLAGGLVLGLLGQHSIRPVEALKWKWSSRKAAHVLGLLLIFGLTQGLALWLLLRLTLGLGRGLVFGLAGAVVGALEGGLLLGLSGTEIQAKMVPNQGIRQSAKNALIVLLVVWLVVGPVGGLLFGLGAGPLGGVLGVLVFGLGAGLAGAFLYGGRAVIFHLVLRCFLWRKGHLPWNLVHFLDYAAERIFLRKVGGGYIFIHRLLQDHFASLYQDQ